VSQPATLLHPTEVRAFTEKYKALHRKLSRRSQQKVPGEASRGFVLLL
jgi:hypothetical protein